MDALPRLGPASFPHLPISDSPTFQHNGIGDTGRGLTIRLRAKLAEREFGVKRMLNTGKPGFSMPDRRFLWRRNLTTPRPSFEASSNRCGSNQAKRKP